MEKPIVRQRKIQKTDKFDASDDNSLDRPLANDSLPNSVGYGILFAFLILLRLFYIYENVLPTQITLQAAKNNPDSFIGERAELQLKRITSLGTRVVGSYENEVLAVDLLKREISFISQGLNRIHRIDVDIQRPTGSYFLEFKPYGFRNYYTNIQNIVVRLSSGNATDSILLNCHYDTVPESPGASDNGLNCAVMLEILNVLSSSNVPLRNNIIFLFNGAEENPLQASHGFSSQHKWRKEVKMVINMDSAGSGGKEVLFQTSGEAWLLNSYGKAVPRPSAAVQAEELFQNGIIPSDTDFRVFRDFGNYSGLDFAHCFNGYVYHTKYDTMDFIRPGVYQFTGDNMLALTKELAQSTELGKTHTKTRLVYFDLFQLYLVSYSEDVAVIVNLVTALLSAASVFHTLKSLPGMNFH
ncbi:hypothetical protein RUM44_005648 [Polyplax serrata]|uniref:Peptidase M28 domain-containing protein n=1 Tax=Polyplax serrata TaxID=468196 RepID=A0ABR1AFJ6_POLSC